MEGRHGNQTGSGPGTDGQNGLFCFRPLSPSYEVVPLRLSFSNSLGVPQVFALDNRGQRSKGVAESVSTGQDEVVIDLLEKQPSLWYEIVFKKQNVRGASRF